MPVRGNRDDFEASGWSRVNVFPCLGHLLEPNGASRACRESVVTSCWRAFWANIPKSASSPLSRSINLGMIDKCVKPLISFRAAGWPFPLQFSKLLDVLQRRMIRSVVPIRRNALESDLEFCRRAARAVSTVQMSCIPWSFYVGC